MLHDAKIAQRKQESRLVRHVDRSVLDSSGFILGKHYQRKTRFREPIVTAKLMRDGLFSIYSKVKYLDLDTDVSAVAIASCSVYTAERRKNLYQDTDVLFNNTEDECLHQPCTC